MYSSFGGSRGGSLSNAVSHETKADDAQFVKAGGVGGGGGSDNRCGREELMPTTGELEER